VQPRNMAAVRRRKCQEANSTGGKSAFLQSIHHLKYTLREKINKLNTILHKRPFEPRKMYPAYYPNGLPSPIIPYPPILFRAACIEKKLLADYITFQDFNMVARATGPSHLLTRKAFNDCLLWNKTQTPFIPFTKSWKKVCKRRQLMSKDGDDVVIITV
jgi:hypothetical protein